MNKKKLCNSHPNKFLLLLKGKYKGENKYV